MFRLATVVCLWVSLSVCESSWISSSPSSSRRRTGLDHVEISQVNAEAISYKPTPAPTTIPIKDIPLTQYSALKDLYLSTNGPSWVWNQTRSSMEIPGIPWNFTDPSVNNPCIDRWAGIGCDCNSLPYCTITELWLRQYNITGIIPMSIGDLTNVTSLTLAQNNFTDSIPVTLYSLRQLTFLDLANNQLEGSLSSALGSLLSLQVLNLSGNSLQSVWPEAIYALTKLTDMDLSYNTFDGSLSNQVLSWTALQSFKCVLCSLSGAFPAAFINLTSLTTIDFRYNSLTSSLPPDFSPLRRLTVFDVGHNKLTGTIPQFGGNKVPASLLFLHLDTNKLVDEIPISLCALPVLKSLFLYDNFLFGSIPSCLVQYNSLDTLNFQVNLLTGEVPKSFTNWTNAKILSCYNNHLEGSAMPLFTNKDELFTVIVAHNMFSGAIPEYASTSGENIGFFPILTVYNVGKNWFTGSLPDSLQYSRALGNIGVDANLLTGSIPLWLGEMRFLDVINLGDNTVTGRIPNNIANNTQLLSELLLNDCLLTGTLPDALGRLRRLSQLSVQGNALTGTVPMAFRNLRRLTTLNLGNNLFRGELTFLCTECPLENVDLGNNAFTGTLPASVFDSPTLETFVASSNCLHGTFPVHLCNASRLSTLVLEGLSTSISCQQPLFPTIRLFNGFVTKYSMTGTIPQCLFDMPALVSLYLSGNALTGSIPANVAKSHLQSISLSHNILTGRLPSDIFDRSWQQLDLSFNKIGHLLPHMHTAFAQNASLSLDVNRLSGDIPGAMRSMQEIDILQGNLFDCSINRDELPTADPESSTYSCGSDVVNTSIVVWIVIILLLILIFALWMVRQYRRKQFPFESHVVNITVTEASKESIAEPIGKDTAYEDVINAALSQARQYIDVLRNTELESKYGGYPLQSFHEINANIREVAGIMLLFAMCILLPTFGGLSIYESTHVDSYAWSLSAIMLSGKASGVVVALVLVIALLFFFSIFMTRVLGAYDSNSDRQNGEPLVVRNHHKSRKEYMVDVASSLIIGLLNFVIMVMLDTAYVMATLRENGTTVLLIQIALSAFKLAWNETTLWRLYPIVKRAAVQTFTPMVLQSHVHETGTDSSSSSSRMGNVSVDGVSIPPTVPTTSSRVEEEPSMELRDFSITHPVPLPVSATSSAVMSSSADSIDSAALPSTVTHRSHQSVQLEGDVTARAYTFSRYEVGYLVFTVILNNIVIPCIAIALVSPDCFYNALFSSPPTEGTTVDVCGVYALLDGNYCLEYYQMTEYATFDIPFIYRYQCSAAFVVNFAAVFIFTFLFVGVILPVSKLCLKLIVDSLSMDSSLRVYLTSLLPATLRPLEATRNATTQTVFVDKDKLVVRLSSYLAIICTFGMLFPPLAFIGYVSILCVTYFEELTAGRLLCQAKERGFSWYRKVMERECKDIVSAWHGVVWLISSLAALSYAFVLFDTIGDRYGWRYALAPVAFVASIPIWIAIYRQVAVRFGLPMWIPHTFDHEVKGKTFEEVYQDVRAASVSVKSRMTTSATASLSVPRSTVLTFPPSHKSPDAVDQETQQRVDNPLHAHH